MSIQKRLGLNMNPSLLRSERSAAALSSLNRVDGLPGRHRDVPRDGARFGAPRAPASPAARPILSAASAPLRMRARHAIAPAPSTAARPAISPRLELRHSPRVDVRSRRHRANEDDHGDDAHDNCQPHLIGGARRRRRKILTAELAPATQRHPQMSGDGRRRRRTDRGRAAALSGFPVQADRPAQRLWRPVVFLGPSPGGADSPIKGTDFAVADGDGRVRASPDFSIRCLQGAADVDITLARHKIKPRQPEG